ncbi:MAG: rhodanese-like domain-containing protein [Acidobacteriota bacterium]|nr:rhodanese-like domain-containing protein [Acidobacteriota bacterium]MDH3523823.1 rhodanese-like domain-containing protein [Acidobacteriota bacterium]
MPPRAFLTLAVAVACLACSGGRGEGGRAPGGHRAVAPGVVFELLRDNPDVLVLDVRPFSAYESATGHLERAVSLPAADLPRLWPALGLSREKTVVLYGDDGGPHQDAATQFLASAGQRYVVRIAGGLEAWRAGGFAVVVEDAPLSPVRLD